jgi:hypothetical protein
VSFDPGDTLISTITAKDEAGNPVDPAVVEFDWRWSDSTTLTTWRFGVDPEITRESTGVFRARLLLSRDGVLYLGWRTTDPSAAEQRTIVVRPWRPASS